MAEIEAEFLRETLARAVRASCPPWLAGEAEDLAQAAALKVLEVVRRDGNGRDLAASYLWRAAHSAVVDEIRRRNRRPETALGSDAWAAMPDGGQPPVEAQAGRRGLREAIRDCLRRLVTPRRRAVILHLQGEPLAEIARLFGWSEKRADNLLYRGLGNLRDCLSGKGYVREPA